MALSCISAGTLDELVAFARGCPPGDLVEVGVYQGGSAQRLAEVAIEQGRRLFLFDTFAGMPHAGEGDFHQVGEFADTSEMAVRALIPGALFRVGVFPDTLTADVGPIAFAHVDCDQYASVRACCEHLAPRMVPGGVMWFDDANCLPRASAAVTECFSGRVQISPTDKWFVRF